MRPSHEGVGLETAFPVSSRMNVCVCVCVWGGGGGGGGGGERERERERDISSETLATLSSYHSIGKKMECYKKGKLLFLAGTKDISLYASNSLSPFLKMFVCNIMLICIKSVLFILVYRDQPPCCSW